MNCMPIGNPSFDMASGTDMAGKPATLASGV